MFDNQAFGKEKRYKGGSFYLVERTLETAGGHEKIVRYIRKNRSNLLARNIHGRFPELDHIPRGKMLFFDIENGGLEIESPIISIAQAHMHHGSEISLECMFARNYVEEKTVLRYFLDKLGDYDAFFTYNGKSFDAPRLRARATHTGLYNPKIMSAGGILGPVEDEGSTTNGNGRNQHHDLYHVCQQKGRVVLADARLKTIEKTLPEFGHTVRKHDLASGDIPRVYYEYANGRKRVTTKVIANPKHWKKCLEQAEAFCPKAEDYTDQKGYAVSIFQDLYKHRDELVKSIAEKLYAGDGEARGEWRQFTEPGGYKEKHSPGEKINEEERSEDMRRLINHNILDTITLVGLLCYLCSPKMPEVPQPVYEDELPF